jgi:hypothetical protein
MPNKTTYVVQAFVMKRGRLGPGTKEVAPTDYAALKRAEAWATRMPGSAAICVVADDETGELASVAILETFGEVPEDFAESLMG